MESRSPTVVYPGRRKLALYFIAQAALIGLSVYLCAWSSLTPPSQVGTFAGMIPVVPLLPLSTGLLALIVGLVCGSIGYRLFRPSPAVTITDYGLVDDCSFLACGVGLIRWQDMEAIYVVRYSNTAAPNYIKRTYLFVRLRDRKAFFASRSVSIRRLHLVSTFLMFSPHVFIPEYMLSGTADQILGSLRNCYETYMETYLAGGYEAAPVPEGLLPHRRAGGNVTL